VIAFALPAPAINGAYDRAGFFRFQIYCHPTDCFLIANGENATVLTCPRYILSEQMLYKTAEGRKTAVSRNGGVPASRLDMFQESEDGVGLDIVQGKIGHGFALLICQE
jgi:hypothetical protein